jgi:hypothetical protein
VSRVIKFLIVLFVVLPVWGLANSWWLHECSEFDRVRMFLTQQAISAERNTLIASWLLIHAAIIACLVKLLRPGNRKIR